MLRYFRMIRNIILNKLFQPKMIWGFRRFDGVYLDLTRMSNTTYIGGKEKLFLENNVFIGHYNFIDASNFVTIKEGCQITNYVSILTHSSHISIRLYGKEYTKFKNLTGYITGKVYIGEYSFIGPHTTIMPDTVIGRGSIITAYSYVQGKYDDYSIISGNPARVVGDTRKLDEKYLNNFADLKVYYNHWTGNDLK